MCHCNYTVVGAPIRSQYYDDMGKLCGFVLCQYSGMLPGGKLMKSQADFYGNENIQTLR